MTHDQYLEISSRVKAGETIRDACGRNEAIRRKFQRYRQRVESGQSAPSQIRKAVKQPTMAKFLVDGLDQEDVDQYMQTLLKIGIEAAATMCQNPCFVPVWRELMRALHPRFKEGNAGTSLEDYKAILEVVIKRNE